MEALELKGLTLVELKKNRETLLDIIHGVGQVMRNLELVERSLWELEEKYFKAIEDERFYHEA